MNRNLLLFTSLIAFFSAHSQNFTGQWKGEFLDKSTSFVGWAGDKCDYVLELDVKGRSVTGSSYTYYQEGGKRYYTICKLQGFVNPKKKYIEVKEIERTKTNVPLNVRNCFQVHRLTYSKEGETENISGDWLPAPDQPGDCGFGTTILTRRLLVNSYPNYNSKLAKSTPTKKKAVTPSAALKVPLAKSAIKAPAKKGPVVAKSNPMVKTAPAIKPDPLTTELISAPVKETPEKKIIPATAAKLEKRETKILKTIEVSQKTVKVDLYDNGEIDGDSVSLFFNGKLLADNKRLSAKPLSFTLNIDEDDQMNELVMYAENLGSIPPNTALMIVTDGAKRYEVRITSDLQKSGVINFVHKPLAGN